MSSEPVQVHDLESLSKLESEDKFNSTSGVNVVKNRDKNKSMNNAYIPSYKIDSMSGMNDSLIMNPQNENRNKSSISQITHAITNLFSGTTNNMNSVNNSFNKDTPVYSSISGVDNDYHAPFLSAQHMPQINLNNKNNTQNNIQNIGKNPAQSIQNPSYNKSPHASQHDIYLAHHPSNDALSDYSGVQKLSENSGK